MHIETDEKLKKMVKKSSKKSFEKDYPKFLIKKALLTAVY